MSKSVERLVKELSSIGNGCELLDLKFFLGDSRNITQEKLAEEAANGLSQIRFDTAEKIEFVDKKLNKLTVEQFLK